MQKDIHFYLTYMLARTAGIQNAEAERIAWANQYTDDLTVADVHGIQTQSRTLGNWGDPQIQLSVLVPFHYVPGYDKKHPWMVTRNNQRAQHLVSVAFDSKDPLQLGIALHALQDTFSHEHFSGWREPLNSCYPWYYINSGVPNIGHAEMAVIPDVANYIWTDPRTGRSVTNPARSILAAQETYGWLTEWAGPCGGRPAWIVVKDWFASLFSLSSYNDRVTAFCKLSGNKSVHYNNVRDRIERHETPGFIRAATRHLASAMRIFDDLPRPASP